MAAALTGIARVPQPCMVLAMTHRLFLPLLLFLAGCASPPPMKPRRFVEVQGAEAEPYKQIAWRHWKRTNIAMSRAEEDRICMEVTGKQLPYDPPHIPGCMGPFVMREMTTSRTYAAIAIGLQATSSWNSSAPNRRR
jgi:hypothetical protein